MITGRHLWRATPYAVLALGALAVTWPLFATRGMPYNVDISGFFPLTPDAYFGRFWPVWNERGGMSTLQFLPALLLESPLLILGKLFAWDMASHVKIRILLGFAAASMSMYALARHYLVREYGTNLSPIWLTLIPLVPALFYAYNPWSVHRVFHYFLWVGYVLTPLVLLALERLAEAPSTRRALVFGGTFALATTDPHNPPYLLLVLAPVGVLRLVQHFRHDRAVALRFTKSVGVAMVAYIGLGAYWILPYAYNIVTNPGFGPTYVMSEQMLGVLSRNADFGSVIRLLHNYLPRAPLSPEGGLALSVWLAASFAIPVLAFNAIILRPRPTVLLYAGIAASCIALGMGDQAPFTQAYRWLLFSAPWGEGLSWLFRDPYRWGGLQALAYCVLVSFTLVEAVILASRAPRALRAWARPIGPVIAAIVAILFVAPAVQGYVGTVFEPVEIPNEYAEANAFLSTTDADSKVIWLPRMLGSTTWSGHRTLAYFDSTSSARAALGPFRPHSSAYFDFVKDSLEDGTDTSAFLARAGTQYVMFHDDRDPARDANLPHLLESAGFQPVGVFGDNPVVVVAASSAAPSNVPASRYGVYGERAVTQSFEVAHASLASITLRVVITGEPQGLNVTIRDADENTIFARDVRPAPDAREIKLRLDGLTVTPGASYSITARARDNASAVGDRYDLSYYRVDTTPTGEIAVSSDGEKWRTLGGDLYYEVRGISSGFALAYQNPRESPRVYATQVPIASPSDLGILSSISSLPRDSTFQQGAVAFTASDASAARAFADGPARWQWITRANGNEWDAVVPFLPSDALIAPFMATTNADSKLGWARGTTAFAYYEWGWKNSLRALGHENREFDGNRGLVYTSANATIAVTVPPSDTAAPRTLLARVYTSPSGGPLAFSSAGSLLATIETRAALPMFKWIEIGRLPEDSSSFTMTNSGGFQGVNVFIAASDDAVSTARAGVAKRFASSSVTIIAEGERIPEFRKNAVVLPTVGKTVKVTTNASLSFFVPVAGVYSTWFRVASPDGSPTFTLDDESVAIDACRANCADAGPWFALESRTLAQGDHTLGIVRNASSPTDTLLDLVVITNTPALLAPASLSRDRTNLTWSRTSATEYQVSVDSSMPFNLVLTDPYDPGWVARIAGRPGVVHASLADGFANGFIIDTTGRLQISISYEPQKWAVAGAWIGAFSALVMIGAFAAAPIYRVARVFRVPDSQSPPSR